ncbi:hypothetical protein M1116_04165 [Patescibacteria group bacterium]|nr:hypothetical protein [Patescibacteria group bacterium]
MSLKEKAFGQLPVTVDIYKDTRPEDTDVEPYRRERTSTMGEMFSEWQLNILQTLSRGVEKPLESFRVSTMHKYYEFRKSHYRASVQVSGEDVEHKHHNLINKASEEYGDYVNWESSGGWVEEADLVRRRGENE